MPHFHLNGFGRLLLSFGVSVLLILVLPVLMLGVSGAWSPWSPSILNDGYGASLSVNCLALVLCSLAMNRFERFPQKNAVAYILPTVFCVYSLVIGTLWILRTPYSVKVTLFGAMLMPLLLSIQHLILNRQRARTFLYIPLGESLQLSNCHYFNFKPLESPKLPKLFYEGVVADMCCDTMTPEWERFLARCALQRVPVYNLRQLNERMTGRVDVNHLAENDFGSLAPSIVQQSLKRLIETTFALWVRLDSPGNAFFIQKRMGLGGKIFNMVKFRTMVANHGGHHFTQADESDRITRVGKILRKYRFDELPQFWNVLTGDMSLIGPRPESTVLAEWYEQDVPFFAYRHVVRPGISGWAQVMQGYAAEVDGMKEKLSYDFYYIKHFSLWLDLLIWYKTIRTVFTGFGSR
jgi:lipopolysaccharide/colanic/teichoic acid biosynthesis glycosyltransferase